MFTRVICDTGMPGQRRVKVISKWSGFSIVTKEMGRARSTPAYNYYTRITSPMVLLPSSPTIRGFTANNLRGSVRYLRQQLERQIARGSAATACLTDRSVDVAVCAAAHAAAHASRRARRLARRLTRVSLPRMVRGWSGVLPDGSLAVLRQRIRFEMGPASYPTDRSRRFGGWFEAGPASCPMARSRRFGGWFARDGPGVLPGGSLASVWFDGLFDAFGACQTARATTASQVR